MVCPKKLKTFLILMIAGLSQLPAQTKNPSQGLSSWVTGPLSCIKHIAVDMLNPHDDSKVQPFTIPNTPLDPEVMGKNIAQLHQNAQKSTYPFLIGASTSEHQSSKRCTPETCSWSLYAQQQKLPQPHDQEAMLNLADNYEAYFAQAKELGLNSLRFSIEWALIEPKEGVINQEELDRYAAMTVCAIKNDITPVICFHHYTDPCWFIKKGGFESKKNSDHFVRFTTLVYTTIINALHENTEIHEKLTTMHPILWATFNNPSGYAFRGYYVNDGPPSDPSKKSIKWVGTVIKNMMEAHVQVYQALNAVYTESSVNKKYIKKPFIGFLKNMAIIDPSHKTLVHTMLSPISRMVSSVANLIANESIFKFFTTGTFKINIPTQISLHHKNKLAPQSLDFIGVNFYSNIYTCMGKKLKETNPAYATDNSTYRIYPQGLYRAISIVSRKIAVPLNIPMYVTENGIATNDDAKRERFYKQYMYALEKSISDGYDVRGYLTWTLADNYEWPTHDHTQKSYGLCSINPEDDTMLHLKTGSQWFSDFAQAVTA